MAVVCENNRIQIKKESDNSEIYFQSTLKNDESRQIPYDSSQMAAIELILEYLQT